MLREEMLPNFRPCCHVFHQSKWKHYNKLHEIYFLSVHWAANMLHATYLWNMFHAICFIGVRRALKMNLFCQNFWISWIMVSSLYYALLHSHEVHDSMLHTTSYLLLVPTYTTRFWGTQNQRVSSIISIVYLVIMSSTEYHRWLHRSKTD